MGKTPPPPKLSYEAIRAHADDFLAKVWSEATAPVNVERIVDARLKIDIISVSGLKDEIGVDGFLSRDANAVYVDERVSKAVPTRYRFTLAHELGHMVLHHDLYASAAFADPAGWLEFQSSLPEREYSQYEYQAYCFGGLVLAPAKHLEGAVKEAILKAKKQNYTIDFGEPADRAYVADWVGRRLGVSGEVIARRGKYDGLWSE